ncbi:hypothetical protein Psfp_01540 [Pelotomaculum sp. FP]|uniref:hypothetical protein n=1 Tax=Pelotomaculum sp. FP TaxID=261474 RepID=UPI001064871B|nr:hypothetical protein [Pelotomaculum sp. FP]TEB16113.1 hypothetical protein Psfp_01540 [Pelotomaculum sp. FP]
MRIKIAILLVALFTIIAYVTGAMALESKNQSLKFDNGEGEVKVFVGQPGGKESMDLYKNRRIDVLKNQSSTEGSKIMEALVVYDKYLTLQETSTFAAKNDINVKNMWIAEPGVQGGGIATVNNTDLSAAYSTWINEFLDYSEQKVSEDKANDITKSHYKAVQEDDFKIYALLVSAPLDLLEDLINESNVWLVDLHYHSDAEKLASQKGYKVKYIDVPEKPY